MIGAEQIVIRLGVAAVLGAAVGLERERLEWVAGLRTHMLVCLGSCLVMIVSAYGFADSLGDPHVVLDPSRVAAQVVSGIGFLGAGTILFLRSEIIRGLTTAASLWTMAAIGLAVGGGLYLAAVTATAIALAILALVKPLERRLFHGRRRRQVAIVVDRERTSLFQLHGVLEAAGLRVIQLALERTGDAGFDRALFTCAQPPGEDRFTRAVAALQATDGVREASA